MLIINVTVCVELHTSYKYDRGNPGHKRFQKKYGKEIKVLAYADDTTIIIRDYNSKTPYLIYMCITNTPKHLKPRVLNKEEQKTGG